MVEDLGTKSRVVSEIYDKNGRVVRGRDLTYDDEEDSLSETVDNNLFAAASAAVNTDAPNTSYGDSVSALSEADADYGMRRENFRQARRRALDDAIDRQDWDLAAALTEGMRHSNYSAGDYER